MVFVPNHVLDCIYLSDLDYDPIKVMKSAVKRDQLTIVMYAGATIMTVNKAMHFLEAYIKRVHQFPSRVSDSSHLANPDSHGYPQEGVDRRYVTME